MSNPEIKQIIKEDEKIRIGLRDSYRFTDIPVTDFEAENITVLYFMACLDPESPCYGTAVGAFTYKEGRVFKFHYNIHTPHSKGPHRSNQIDSIEEIKMSCYQGIPVPEYINTTFGMKGLWHNTPDSCLNEEERSLRMLAKSIQKYCRKEKFCEKLRKLDKAHCEWEEGRKI